MTNSKATMRCEWCGGEFVASGGPGRPARYCRRSHRQRAYEARQIAGERGIAVDEVLISKRSWEQLRDSLYCLEAAAEDVAVDVAGTRTTKADYEEALTHLTSAANDLRGIAIEPIAIGKA